MRSGMLELIAATAKKTPVYRTHGFLANPVIERPTSAMQQLKKRTGARVRKRSAYRADAIISIPAATYGGVVRHCDAARLNLSVSLKIIGK